MRKLKKSLAVLLAALMLASFMPLFASAEAITINRNNVKIVPPTVTPSVIQYGENLSGLTVTGGECWYVDPDTGAETLVPGHFELRSTTTKPAINEAYSIQLKFVSDDTTQYSNISTLLGTTVTLKSGTWPTIKVNGLDGTLVEAPAAAAIQEGQQLTNATLSGGVVNDAEGNPVSGTWSYVYPSTYPRESGKYEVKFKATDYNLLYTTVDVNVTPGAKVSLEESPATKRVIAGGRLSTATLSGGKVVDENGAEITTGSWKWVNDATQDTSIKLETLGTFTYKAQWIAVGYEIITVDVPVLVAADKGYTVDKPTLASPVTYVVGLTFDKLPFVYGEASVPGTYTTNQDGTKVSSNKNATQSVTLTFTPDDKTLDVTSWTYSFKVQKNDIWYTPSEETLKIVVPYGWSDNSVSYYSNTGNLYGALNWPDHFMEQGVYSFSWSKDNYDIASMEVGEMILVNGSVWYNRIDSTVSLMYSTVPEEVYIQIQPGVYKGEMGHFSITVADRITQKCAVRYSCSIPGITGTVTLRQGETVLGTFTPDENGEIKETVYFTPEEDGKYAFTATYTPGVMDKVTIENPVLTSNEVDLDIKKQIDVFVYDNELALYKQEKSTCGAESLSVVVLDPGQGYIESDIERWEAYDQNGNKVQLYDSLGNPVIGAKTTRLSYVVPSEESGITELHLYPIGPWSPEDSFNSTPQDNSMLGRLLEYWQKLIDFIIEIYQTIASIFDVT